MYAFFGVLVVELSFLSKYSASGLARCSTFELHRCQQCQADGDNSACNCLAALSRQVPAHGAFAQLRTESLMLRSIWDRSAATRPARLRSAAEALVVTCWGHECAYPDYCTCCCQKPACFCNALLLHAKL